MNIPDHDWQLEAPYQRGCEEAEKFEHWLQNNEHSLHETYIERFPERISDGDYDEERFEEWAFGQYEREVGV